MHYVHDIYVKIMKKMGKNFFLTYDGFEPTDLRVAGPPPENSKYYYSKVCTLNNCIQNGARVLHTNPRWV